MSEEWIIAGLRALAESDREAQASPEVEVRVLRAFRRRRAGRRAMMWGSAAAAAVIAGIVIWKGKDPKPVPVAPVTTVATVTPPAVVDPPPPKPPLRKRIPKPRTEIVTEFYPLTDLAPPFESGQLIRVTMPAGALRNVGLPVNEDRLGDTVQADVLVGQEGFARAIRLVSFQQ